MDGCCERFASKERFIQFLKENILSKYKSRLLVFDNASSHRNNDVRNGIKESGNNYLYYVPYVDKTVVVCEGCINGNNMLVRTN